jgi:hypothetical protein
MGNLSLGNVSSRDLDGRPTNILRSSVYLWIQRCPSCGYCAPEIASGEESDRTVVSSDSYRRQLDDGNFPETANAFLCHNIIMCNRDLFADAAWATVFAAWICDDNGYVESARLCRGNAIELFKKARAYGQNFAESNVQEQIYLIDLHRRKAEFEVASELCEEALLEEHTDKMFDLLYFEQELIDKRDSAGHSVSEADDPSV